MKKICTLFIFSLSLIRTKAQVLLNEIYATPGSGRHEFFELYNNAPSSVPESMDNYTLITYFEGSSNVTGFYVLDLPALSVASKGYFTAAAAIPFNYQGISNCTAADFNWNDAVFLAANNGYLKKWVKGTVVPAAVDGNANYDEQTVPANFNDLFSKVGGGAASFSAFLYKNGSLVNAFLGGVGGSTTMPSYITTMPDLFVNMAGAAPDFTITFSTYNTVSAEFVIEEAGSDNGYIRTRDGFCGAWGKSTNQVTHTPNQTNGMGAVPDGTISVAASTLGGSPTSGSTVTYDVVGAPTTSFPITMHVYTDVGSSSMNLDGTDQYVASNMETVVSDGGFSTTFFPNTANVLIVTISNAGCIDNVRFIPTTSVLPVQVLAFSGSVQNQKTQLEWRVSENENVQSFEVESSNSLVHFTSLAIVMGTDKAGAAHYLYKESKENSGNRYYRLKIINKQNAVTYSPVIRLSHSEAAPSAIRLLENPVRQQLLVQFTTSTAGSKTATLYTLSGLKMFSTAISTTQGVNQLNLNLNTAVLPGLYILEIAGAAENLRTKFIKQ